MAKYENCLLNQNLTRTEFCGYSLKQISDIYLANYADVSTNLSTDSTSGGSLVNGYTVIGTTLEKDAKWYHIEPAKDSSSYNDDLVVGGNGSKYRTHTMTFSFNSEYNENVANALDMLSLGRFVAILKLSDGNGIMLGRLTGLEASAASSLSEAAADGQNGITITLECNTTEPALVVSGDVIKKLDVYEPPTKPEDEGEGA